MIKTVIDMAVDKITDNIYLTDLKKTIDEFSVTMNWKNVTGTPNGTIDIIAVIDDSERDANDIIDTINIDSLTGKETRFGTIDCQAIRFEYEGNNILGGTLEIVTKLSGK